MSIAYLDVHDALSSRHSSNGGLSSVESLRPQFARPLVHCLALMLWPAAGLAFFASLLMLEEARKWLVRRRHPPLAGTSP
ncbi:hypothetical protein [Azotobacter armeniacus]